MFLLLCPHIWSNRLGSRATCFPWNICPPLSWEPHWLHTQYCCQSLLEVAGVGCVVGMALVLPVLTGICGKWDGQSRNVGVGKEWTSVSRGLWLFHMDPGSSQRVSSMVRWYRSILLWHRLSCLFSTGVLVSNVHLAPEPGLDIPSVCPLPGGILMWSGVPSRVVYWGIRRSERWTQSPSQRWHGTAYHVLRIHG